MIQNDELRYKISDLHQLSQCMSNNSRDLRIRVSDFLHDDRLSGIRVSVEHTEFGNLFTYIFDVSGRLITEYEGVDVPCISYSELFVELAKFGFFVEYEDENILPFEQIEYLDEIQHLGFDKIRVLTIKNNATSSSCIVAFKAGDLPKWLNNTYVASQIEANLAFVKGVALNLSEVSKAKDYQWGWLDFVANIIDIIKNNPDQASKLHDLHWYQA